MPVFNTEEERLAYLISLNSTDAMKQLKEFIASSNSSTQALERLTKVTMEYARIAKISFNSAKMSMAELNMAYKQAVASGNALSGGVGGAGGLGGVGASGEYDPNFFRQGGGTSGIGGIPPTLEKITSGAGKAKSALSSLATTFRHVIVGMLAFRVIQFFMDIVKGIGAATEAAKDFYKSLVNVEMGVRAMQRAGQGGSLRETVELITELRKEFPVLSTPELTDALDNIILRTAQMGLTWKDLTDILTVAAGVYSVTGQNMEQTSDAILAAMMSSSGRMTITLSNNTNLQITQLMLVAKAKELEIKNIEKGISALSAEERARVVLAVIMEQYAESQKDIDKSMKTVPAQVDAVSKSWVDLQTKIGTVFLYIKAQFAPTMLLVLDTMLKAFPKVVSYLMLFLKMTWFINSALSGLVLGIVTFFNSATDGVGTFKEAVKSFFDGFKSGFNESQAFFDNVAKGVLDTVGDIEKVFGDRGSILGLKLAKGINDGLEEGLTEDQLSALEDFERSIEEMALDIQRTLEQDLIDLGRKFTDIDTDYKRQLVEIIKDYERGIADANEQAMESIADANTKYRENELKEEDDYQRKLQRLRDEFLFDLEDALRARDAGQVLRLIRRYNLDKKNLVQENNEQQEERRKTLAEELADIEKQRQRKLADLLEEMNYKRNKAVEDWLRDRADAQTRFDQDQEDEKRRNAYKLQDLVDALSEQGLATLAGAEAIRSIMMTYFGPGGYTDKIYNYLIAKIRAAAAIASAMAKAMGGGAVGGNAKNQPMQFASGGAMIASRPTTAVFGEGGEPELAVFLPLSKLKSPTARSSLTSGASGGGKIKLEVLLSPDLEARIIQQAANNVAATITKIQREK
jgi:hypothetical protein